MWAGWSRVRAPSEPVRTFSVPSGFSSTRPHLTWGLAATALLACSTAAVGTLVTASWTDARAVLPEAATIAPPVEPTTGGALLIPIPEPTLPDIGAADLPDAPAQPHGSAAESAVEPPSPSPSAPTRGDTNTAAPAPATDAPAVDKISRTPGSRPGEGAYAGVWATDEKACSPQLKRDGLLPALISAEGAWAGETTCSFRSGKRVGSTWTFAAVRSDARRRWKTNVRMSVAGDRLTWTSRRGSQTYVRCQPGLLHARGQKRSSSSV